MIGSGTSASFYEVCSRGGIFRKNRPTNKINKAQHKHQYVILQQTPSTLTCYSKIV